jgi:putative membrane protein
MNGLAQAAALVSAVVYIAAAPLELFFFNSPRVRALLHAESDSVADVRMWAFCIAFRNLLAGIGAIVRHPVDRR